MKIILITASFVIVTNSLFSQNSPGAPTKSLTVEEANRINGTAQPTINGKPYSQFKTEQEALKKQKQAQQQAQLSQDASLTVVRAADVKPAPAKPQPVQNKMDNETIENKPAVPASSTVVKSGVEEPANTVATRPASAAILDHFGNGQVIEPAKPAPADPQSFTGIQEAAKAGKQPQAPAKATPASRTAAEIEKANQQQAAAAKVQPANKDVPATTERPVQSKTQPGQEN